MTIGDKKCSLNKVEAMQNGRTVCRSDALRKIGMQLIADGVTAVQIAEQLGVSVRTVRRWRHRETVERVARQNFGRPRLTEDDVEQLLVAKQNICFRDLQLDNSRGWNTEAFRRLILLVFPDAAEVHMSLQSIRKFLKRNGFRWHRFQWYRQGATKTDTQAANLANAAHASKE